MQHFDARMVLRTVYLTPEVDDQLRICAAKEGRSKHDIMCDAIKAYLQIEELEQELEPFPFCDNGLIGQTVTLRGAKNYSLVIESVNLTPYHPGLSDPYRFILYPECNPEIKLKARLEDLDLNDEQLDFYEKNSRTEVVEKMFMGQTAV